MRRRLLPVLLLAECLVLAALGLAAWHLMAARAEAAHAPRSHPPAARSPEAPAGAQRPATPSVAGLAPTASPPAAALSTAAPFWQAHLGRVNRDESNLEGAEWRAVQAVEAFARAYLENVVMPAVRAAAGGRS